MNCRNTGRIAIALLCMAVLGGCVANNNIVSDTKISQIEQTLQSQEMENTLTSKKTIVYDYVTEECYAKRDDNNIYGVIYIPQNAGEQLPAVIFSHGFGGDYQVGTQYAKALAAKGMTLPTYLSAEEETTREYEIGDLGYWDAGPDLAIFYDDIYEKTVVPVIPIGKANSGAELLANAYGTVKLELIKMVTNDIE